MKVFLTVPSLDIESFKGLARVSLELVKRLKDRVDLHVYDVLGKGKNYFKTLTTVPINQLIERADIFHATSPECGIFLPFFKKNTVATFHDFIPFEFSETLGYRKKIIVKNYAKFAWSLASKCKVIVANSSQTAKEIEKHYKRKAIVINPGVDNLKHMKIKKEKITLGFFANFSYRKRANIAIEVFKILKERTDYQLILAGGALYTQYQEQFDIANMIRGLDDVKVLGFVPEKKIQELYNSFDVFIFPSSYEGFGIPILEAQRCGIPTFIMEDARIPEETAKFAIRCGSPEDMANKVMALFHDKSKYSKISKNGMKYAEKFTWEKFVDSYLKIYEALAKSKT